MPAAGYARAQGADDRLTHARAHPGSPRGVVTVSVGVASVVPGDGETVDQLVRSADDALYAANSGGRNRTAG